MNTLLYNMLFLLMFMFSNCMQEDDLKKSLINGDRDSIIAAAIWIQKHETKDTSIVIQLLTHILDPRVCTSVNYYMQTPYLSRIAALEKVTGEKSPYKVDKDLNALIVDYYLNWAISRGLINSKDDIDLVAPYLREITDSKSLIDDILNHEKVTWLDKYSWKRPPLDKDKFHN